MSDGNAQGVGSITWVDLTVPDAAALRDFYGEVVGWTATPVDMGGYNDFSMLPPAADVPAAGICFARGENAELVRSQFEREWRNGEIELEIEGL